MIDFAIKHLFPNHFGIWGSKLKGLMLKLGWLGQHWGTSITLVVVIFTFFFSYLPDVISSQTLDDVVIIDTGQNTSNYVMKLELPSTGNRGIPQATEVRNVRQLSDFHAFPAMLQDEATSIAEHNKAVRQGKAGEIVKVRARLSGFGVGEANRASNITQIDPTFPGFIYNLAGWAVVVLYWIMLPVLLPKLLLWRRNYLTFGLAGLVVAAYIVDWYIL